MNIEEFAKSLSENIDSISTHNYCKEENPNNTIMPSTTNPDFQSISGIVNYAISLLSFDEAHLHIGTDCKILGQSIYNHLDKQHYLLGDFSANPTLRAGMTSWLQKSGYKPYIKRASGNITKILRNHFYFINHKIGVCFINQFFAEEDNIKILSLLENYLADKAVVIINSVNSRERINTIYSWLGSTTNAKLIFDLPSKIKTDIAKLENIYVIGYERKNS